jgi:hypothetical protein
VGIDQPSNQSRTGQKGTRGGPEGGRVAGANDSPVHITGAPLVIGFEELFLRPAEEEKGEGYIIIGEASSYLGTALYKLLRS